MVMAVALTLVNESWEARYHRALDAMARAKTLHAVVVDRQPGDSKDGVRRDCWYQKPNLFRVTWAGGGVASDGRHQRAFAEGLGWYDDFGAPAAIPDDWRWPGLESFFEGRRVAFERLDAEPGYFALKTTEAAVFFGTQKWSLRTMLPVGYDFWERDQHTHSVTFEKVDVGATPPRGCFAPP